MSKNTLLFLLLIYGFGMHAQSDDAYHVIQSKKIDVNIFNTLYGLTEEQLAEVKGTPYANDTFINGNVTKNGQAVITSKLMRYNALSDEIELKKTKATAPKDYQSLTKDPNFIIRIGGDIYTYIIPPNTDKKGRYFQVLSDEKRFKLCKKIEARYIPPKFAKTSYEKDKPAKFQKDQTYYLTTEEGNLQELPSKKSKVLKVMGSKEKEIKKYIKVARINLSEEKDLIKLVNYYNNLF